MIIIELLVGEEIVRISHDQFEAWVREGRIVESQPLRFLPVTGDSFVPAGQFPLFQAVSDDYQARVLRRFTLRKPATVTLLLTFTCLVLWGLVTASSVDVGMPLQAALAGLPSDVLVGFGAKEPGHMVELGQWWRLYTAVFLHAGLLHLLSNIAYVAYVGWNVESVYGSRGTLVILLTSALCASLTSFLGTDHPSVGASGITFGLFAASVVFGWRFGHLLPATARARFGWAFVPFLVLFFLMGLRQPLVDNYSHVGGCLGGGLAGLLLQPSLVDKEGEGRWRGKLRGFAALGLASLPLGMTLLALGIPSLRTPSLSASFTEPISGISIPLPSWWRVRRDPEGGYLFISSTRREELAFRVFDAGPSLFSAAALFQADLAAEGYPVATIDSVPDNRGPQEGETWQARLNSPTGVIMAQRHVMTTPSATLHLTFLHPEEDARIYAPLEARILKELKEMGKE